MGEADTDRQLLDRYAVADDATAFGELVRRYADFVYAVARRQSGGDPHAADDVTQAVFLVLARRAASVPGHAIGGWLFRVTRYAAADARKRAVRRGRHERAAAAERPEAVMPTDTHAMQEDADRSAAVLDEALAALSAADRESVILRYLRGLDYPAVAAALGVGEAAARKRVTRAVARLRGRFAARGVEAAGSAVVAALSLASAGHAPAATVAAAFAMSPATAGPAVAALGEGVLHLMFWKTIKTVAAVVLAVAFVSVLGVEISRRVMAAAPQALDLESLRGRWQFVSLEDSGRAFPPERVNGSSATFDGDLMTLTLNGEKPHQARVRIDPTHTPAWIDVMPIRDPAGPEPRTLQGLCELRGDELRIVHSERPDERSTAFESKSMSANDALYVLKRAAAATTAPATSSADANEAASVIRPGDGIGPLRLGMTLADAEKTLGPPTRRIGRSLDYPDRGLAVMAGANADGVRQILAGSFTGQPDDLLVRTFKARTAEGLGMGSSARQIIDAFGAPDKAEVQGPWNTLGYNQRGIIFRLNDDRVVHITVLPPRGK